MVLLIVVQLVGARAVVLLNAELLDVVMLVPVVPLTDVMLEALLAALADARRGAPVPAPVVLLTDALHDALLASLSRTFEVQCSTKSCCSTS